jgi:glyoxylase-like metal-dependent hydrolase (beta-lactamase superfamily II)
VNSAIVVRIRQFRLPPPAAADGSPEQLVSQFALLLDAGGLCMPPEAIDEGDELLVLISHTHADHCSGIAALCSARDLRGCKTRIVLPAVGAEHVRRTLALSELLNDASGSTRYQVIIQPVITTAAEPAQASPLDGMEPAQASSLGDPLATGGGIVLRPLELGEWIAADGERIIVPFPTVREPSLSASDCIRLYGFVWPCGCVSEWV